MPNTKATETILFLFFLQALSDFIEAIDAFGLSSERRIDHIFVSPEMTVLESEYGVSPASDHPYMYTVVQL